MALLQNIFDKTTNADVNLLIQQRNLKTQLDQSEKDGLNENPKVKSWVLMISIVLAIIFAIMLAVRQNPQIITYFREEPPEPTKFQLFEAKALEFYLELKKAVNERFPFE